MSLDFKVFVETKNEDGYWIESNVDVGFLASYRADFDGYITENLFVGLSNMSDGYFSRLLKRKLPDDISDTIDYKLQMYACLGNNSVYYLFLDEINMFDWSKEVYSSFLTVPTTFYDVAPDFLLYYVTTLNSLGPPDKVRLIILKKG